MAYRPPQIRKYNNRTVVLFGMVELIIIFSDLFSILSIIIKYIFCVYHYYCSINNMCV